MNPAFNDDLDDYINDRKDKGKLQKRAFWTIKKKQKVKQQEELDLEDEDSNDNNQSEAREVKFSFISIFRKRIPDERLIAKEQADKAASMAAQLDSKLQPETQIVEDDEFEEDESVMNDEPETKSEPSFISKIFGGKKKQDEEEQLLQQQQQQDLDDMKETIKILHKWLEKLPPERIAEFKKSPDFEMYKEGLRKLGLIKE